MKQLFLLAATIIFASCSQNTPTQLSEQEKQSIKAEVQKVTNSIIDLASILNMKLFDFFDSSSSYISFGQMFNYVERRAAFEEGAAKMKSQKITTKFEEHWVLDKDNVYWIWHGDLSPTYKNDSTSTLKNYSVTSLFKRVGNNWKLMHSHESAP